MGPREEFVHLYLHSYFFLSVNFSSVKFLKNLAIRQRLGEDCTFHDLLLKLHFRALLVVAGLQLALKGKLERLSRPFLPRRPRVRVPPLRGFFEGLWVLRQDSTTSTSRKDLL